MKIIEIKKSCYGVSQMTLWRKKQQKLKDKTDALRKRVARAKQLSKQKKSGTKRPNYTSEKED